MDKRSLISPMQFQATPKDKSAKVYSSPDPITHKSTNYRKGQTTVESPSPKNWRGEVQQNSRKASAFIETGDKMSIKSPCQAFEPSEFMNLKPTKLDLTGEDFEMDRG